MKTDRSIRVGISGWRYAGWRGSFYPEDLPQRRELEFASRQLNSIEINGSFYSLQTPARYLSWYEQTPKDFVFSVKASRYITHIKQLNNIEHGLANFFASGPLCLKEKLGSFLWQFPPRMVWNEEKFSRFLSLLPRGFSEAAEIGGDCDPWIKKLGGLKIDKNRRIRHAVEIRNQSFMVPEFFKLLKKHKVAFVFADTAGKWPYAEEITSDFLYLRLHGDEELYVSGYDEISLNRWAKKIMAWRKKGAKNVYVYFDNDVKVRAPYDALTLLQKLTDFTPAEPMDVRALKGRTEKPPVINPRTRWPFRKVG